MNLPAGIPAWTLRALILGTVLAILGLLSGQGVAGFPLALIGVFGAFSVLVPASPAPAMVIIATAVAATVASVDPLDVAVLALLPLVHLVHIGCALAAVIPGTARVHLSALRPAAVRFVVVQGVTAVLAAVALVVPNGVTPTVLEAAGLIGVAVLAGVVAKVILKRPL
jgi:hypothetical protein